MIELPYINTRAHLAAMMQNYDAFAGQYNADINAKRKAEPKQQEKYQTLKPTHRAIFKDLILEIGKKMLQHINNYEKINAEQGNTGTFKLLRNPLIGDGFFVCSTNRYQLSKHSAKELSTVYRNILRLMEAGVIMKKVGHGKKSNFELHINADFLLVSDRANPEYNPQNARQTCPEKDFSLLGKIAECKEEKSVQEHLINKIYSASLDEVNFPDQKPEADTNQLNGKIGGVEPTASSDNTTGSVNQLPAGTMTGTEGMTKPVPGSETEKRTEKPTGGRADVQNMLKNKGIDFVKVFCKRDPAQWHAFHRLSHAAYFVDYIIQSIYARRGVEIFPAARIAAIEYAEKHYFPNPLQRDVKYRFAPCETLDQYSHRLNQLKWCVDAANRYAAKKGAYFVLISKYIDLENENGLKAIVSWWKNAKQNADDKAKHLKNIKEMKQLHEITRQTAEGKITLMQAEELIENHLPKYKFVFRHSLVTIVNQLNK